VETLLRKHDEGMAMPLTLVVMLVLTLLGTALWQYSVTGLMHVRKDETRMQSYYLARAGAEATLQAWRQAGKNNKPVGASDTLYLDKNTNTFVLDKPANSGGKTNVTITTAGNITTIVSTGEVDGLQQRATVTLLSEFTYGHSLNWYSETSGQIQAPSGYIHPPNPPGIYESVILRAKDTGNALQTIKDPETPTTFEAMALFFESPVKTHKTLTLIAETIVFDADVQLKGTGQQDGAIMLFVPEKPALGISMGVSIDGTANRYGKIYFKKNIYIEQQNQAETISGKSFYFLKTSNGLNLKDVTIRYLGETVVKKLNGTTVTGDPTLIQFNPSVNWPSATETLKVTWK
jgi:Tfp pilus assembly protein PilV